MKTFFIGAIGGFIGAIVGLIASQLSGGMGVVCLVLGMIIVTLVLYFD